MIQNKLGEMIFDEQDVCDLLMSGREPGSIKRMLVDQTVNIEQAVQYMETYPELIQYAGKKVY